MAVEAFTSHGGKSMHTNITVTKMSDLSLETPAILCPAQATFNLAVIILEITASHTSHATLHAAVAFSSSVMPTPSFLVAFLLLLGNR